MRTEGNEEHARQGSFHLQEHMYCPKEKVSRRRNTPGMASEGESEARSAVLHCDRKLSGITVNGCMKTRTCKQCYLSIRQGHLQTKC